MFVLNPFGGDINPSTPEGSEIFIKATEGSKVEDRSKVSQVNSKINLALMECFG